MITLDHVQSLALRKSASASVDVGGRSGTGKSTLANAIATEAAREGKTCLLVGDNSALDSPLSYSIVGEIHGVLADRAQLMHPSAAPQEALPHRGGLSNPVPRETVCQLKTSARSSRNSAKPATPLGICRSISRR